MSQPRYRQLADALRADIANGRYPVGAQLPTEAELCSTHAVSRYTAREALRLLREAGQVERRRGAGTKVVRPGSAGRFVQPLGGVDELLQYARDARLQIETAVRRPLDPDEATWLGVSADEPWVVLDGLRGPVRAPLATVRIFVAPDFAGIEAEIRGWTSAVQELIALRFGATPVRIEQQIGAETLDGATARRLKAPRGSAALRTRRLYFDAADRLLLASDSLHPAARFSYAMSYRRQP